MNIPDDLKHSNQFGSVDLFIALQAEIDFKLMTETLKLIFI